MSDLQEDVKRYLRVYNNNVSSVLHQQLPPKIADSLEEKLDEEFAEFRSHLLNRLVNLQ
jgi:predicted house-cleaning noncanonical NTP pyrophosphatase (MazG superfamily)